MIITFKSDVKKRKKFFTPESFSHPAKMSLGLLLWITGKYTKPGETILDPMAGSGSTMLAARYGRSVVLVELEQKFVDMAKANWDKIKSLPKTKFGLGRCVIVQGDARNLNGLLADSIITSPPYGVGHGDEGGKTHQDKKPDGKGGWVYGAFWHANKDNPNNIGNAPYGSIDTVISSPPFGDMNHPTNYLGKQKGESGFEYSDDPNNIGNLSYGQVDAVVSSPPYESTAVPPHTQEGEMLRLEIAKQRGVSPDKVSFMDYTKKQPDIIVTSPPFQEADVQRPGKAQSSQNYNYGSKQKHQGQSPDNIANLAERNYGSIDAVITSPPYEATFNEKQHNLSGIAGRDLSMRREVGGYSGKVDAVISSPPYAEAVHSTNQSVEHLVSKGIKPSVGNQIFSMEQGYSEEPGNIGNLKYGVVDAVISSPPYEGTITQGGNTEVHKAKYGYQGKNIGYAERKVDAVISSPPYEGSLQGDVEDKISSGFNSPQAIKIIESQARGYSKEPDNIGNLRADTYLEAMLKVYQQCYEVLKPNGLMILVTKDFIRKGQRILLSIDTIALCERAGFAYEDWHQRKLTQQSFWRTIYYQKHPEVERLDTEDILVFRKAEGNGLVDKVVFSPPFKEQMQDTDWINKNHPRLHWGKHNPKEQDPRNIGNLPYDGAKINEEWIRSRQREI